MGRKFESNCIHNKHATVCKYLSENVKFTLLHIHFRLKKHVFQFKLLYIKYRIKNSLICQEKKYLFSK